MSVAGRTGAGRTDMTVSGILWLAASRSAQPRARREWSEPSTPTKIPLIAGSLASQADRLVLDYSIVASREGETGHRSRDRRPGYRAGAGSTRSVIRGLVRRGSRQVDHPAGDVDGVGAQA